MPDEIYRFENGITVHRRHLLDYQVNRYQTGGGGNLHEPEEESWFLKLIRDCPAESPLFYDIGGGIGYYSLLFLHERPSGQAVAIEALPEHATAIRENLALNGIAPERLRLLELAAHAHDGEVGFEINDFSSHVIEEGGTAPRQLRVPARDIAAILAEAPRPIDIAKLDVQGAETVLLERVISGGQAAQVTSWIIGTHGDALFDRCVSLLEPHWRILHQDRTPPFQPDGLIVASRR